VAAGGDAAARRAPERQRERGWRRGRGRMALFRKFFLKKTPDRLLEISERVYGIMLSPLCRAGSCGCGIRGGASRSATGFSGSLLVLGVSNFSEVFIYRSSIELEFGAFGSRIADNKQLGSVDFELDSGIWYVCGFEGVETVYRFIAAFGLNRFICFLL